MKYRLRHLTRYTYEDKVELAGHYLHLMPRAIANQSVLAADLRSDPAPRKLVHGVDHFGNVVCWLFLEQPHQRFELVSESLVLVEPRPVPGPTLPHERVAHDARAGGTGFSVAEYCFDSPKITIDAATAAYAARFFTPGRPVFEASEALMRAIGEEFGFRAGVTNVATTVAQVMKLKAGVCQDFAHLMIACLRSAGVPARYVSGYIRTRPPAGVARRLGADQSHAWVEVWMGDAQGWVAFDPTNRLVVGDEHVVLGWGRDFADVSPLRGVILGGGRHRVSVVVELEPC